MSSLWRRRDRNDLMKTIKDVKAGIVKWPMSVIRLKLKERNLIDLAIEALKEWKEYSDKEIDIFAYSGDEKYHTTLLLQ